MRVALRTTAGQTIGFGHLRRCMTLAGEIVARGSEVRFLLTGDEAGPALAGAAGFAATPVAAGAAAILAASGDAEALVVDDYAIGSPELAALHAGRDGRRLLVIDDLADRDLAADLVLNGNADATTLPYRTSDGCRLLLGPRFSLLRSSFRGLPKRRAAAAIRRLLITLGGADPAGRTAAVLAELLPVFVDAHFDVLVGPLFGDVAPLEALARSRPETVRLHRALSDPAPLMREADLAIAAGGQTTYELAAAGVPTVALCLADNQRGSLAALAELPTLRVVGERHRTIGANAIRLAFDRDLRQRMIDAGQALVDGEGAARVAAALDDTRARGERIHA